MKNNEKVIVISDVFHLTSCSSLKGKEGEVVRRKADGSRTVLVKFPKGTIKGIMKGEPMLSVDESCLIRKDDYEAFIEGLGKLTKNERKLMHKKSLI